jgi:hypothetical protein
LGGKWEEVKKNLLPLLPLATKHGNLLFFLPLAIEQKNLLLLLPWATKLGTFHWPPNIETFIWPPSFGSTFTSLFLLFIRRTWIIGGLSFPGHNFQFNLENTCSHKLLEDEKNDQLWSWEKEGE